MRSSKAGYTLVELTIVIVIMAVFVGLVAISMSAGVSPDYKIRETARRTAGTLESARTQATITGRTAFIEYDFESQVLRLFTLRALEEDEEFDEEEPQQYYEARGTVTFGDPEDPEGSKVWLVDVQGWDGKVYDSGKLTVRVPPIGTPMGHTVHLRSRNGEDFSVDLNPLTMVARVIDSHVKPPEVEKDG